MVILRGTFWWRRVSQSGTVIRSGSTHNDINPDTINDWLEVYFLNGSQTTAWYAGLIRDDNYTGLSSADTMASHSGWEEADTEYSDVTRPQWSPPAPTSQILINTSPMEFSFTVAQTIKGAFIASDNTKGGTSGTLWSTGLFDADQILPIGETFQLKYELSAREG